MPPTGYNSDYYSSAYLLYMDDSAPSVDNVVSDYDFSIYYDSTDTAGANTTPPTGETDDSAAPLTYTS